MYKLIVFLLHKYQALLVPLMLLSTPAVAENTYSIYIDADFSGTQSSSLSIKQGINTALAEVDFKIQGYIFDIVLKDHRANPLDSRENLQSFLNDDNALVVFSGLHSPPILSNKSFINNNKVLLLDPWAAAGPITRSTDIENWIFRLSIDDTKAGAFISRCALAEGFKKPFILLEDTSWGRSNHKEIVLALRGENINPSGIDWFNWGVETTHAKLMLSKITESGADVIFFIGNAPEGISFVNAMIELPKHFHLPIRSHWGITGGDFTEKTTLSTREQLDLQFIQTKFSFLNESLTPFATSVLIQAIKSNKSIASKHDIKAQTGFVHSYDLTKLLIAAINQAGLTGNKAIDKKAIHKALENLKHPVMGLVKEYNQPFSPYSTSRLDAHEALDTKDYAMGFYDSNGEVLIIKKE
ncbi:ABC transporter substrate-binding protein [Colwellia piezophila]|uniref:ABC transporter substrate-binding protein n=1 Tax=Colwellia piezophila TaxID=211668 RepID=UPI0003624DB7|nr:ABC transporter substrate-binding protein [Colwellia piezophila]